MDSRSVDLPIPFRRVREVFPAFLLPCPRSKLRGHTASLRRAPYGAAAKVRRVPTVLDAPPAWAQSPLRGPASATLPPFGANLFQGNFASTYSESVNADYVILPGDRIVVRIWGAKTYDDVLMVDQQGNVFLPEVGPIRVAGLKQGQLLGAVRSSLASVFTDNVNIYVNLQSSQPVAVYVAGFVNHPGRYAGGPMDSVMSYLDRAGGITPERGSYRHIKVMRGKSLIGTVDLYDFALRGEMPSIRLKDGDVILVDERGSSVAALGLLRQQAVMNSWARRPGRTFSISLRR